MPLLSGGTHVESCPAGCTVDHSGDEEGAFLEDLSHVIGEPVEMGVDVFDAKGGTITLPILRAHVQVDPYSGAPRFRVPHVTFEPAQDDVMEGLDPDAFATVIRKIRAHVDVKLERVLAQLVQARAEWQQQVQLVMVRGPQSSPGSPSQSESP